MEGFEYKVRFHLQRGRIICTGKSKHTWYIEVLILISTN